MKICFERLSSAVSYFDGKTNVTGMWNEVFRKIFRRKKDEVRTADRHLEEVTERWRAMI
jgi:hypothetical protein